MMLPANRFAAASANCAVGGADFPSCAFRTAAQSPAAHALDEIEIGIGADGEDELVVFHAPVPSPMYSICFAAVSIPMTLALLPEVVGASILPGYVIAPHRQMVHCSHLSNQPRICPPIPAPHPGCRLSSS